VENVLVAWNFSHFPIYLQTIIKIDGNLTKFWQKQFCTVFSETPCIYRNTSPAPEKPGKYLKRLFRRQRSIYTHFPAPDKCLYYTLTWRRRGRRSQRSIYLHRCLVIGNDGGGILMMKVSLW